MRNITLSGTVANFGQVDKARTTGEEEVNGIISYDRKIVKMDEKTVKKLNEKLHF